MILAGDVGGTKVWLQLSSAEASGGGVLFERKYRSSEHDGLHALLHTFLAECRRAQGSRARIRSACFGVAGPVSQGSAALTNLPWTLDASEIGAAFGIAAVRLVNDCEAAAHGIDGLQPESMATVQQGEASPRGTRVLLGAGTGFGVAYATWCGSGYHVIAGEGGHMGFSPEDEQQAALWRDIHAREGRVKVEHILSGSGLAGIHAFLCRTGGHVAEEEPTGQRAALVTSPEEIVQAALSGHSVVALAAVDTFAACFGAAAGDHALAVMARGGVYLAGGIAPAILPRLRDGRFLKAFCGKGAHGDLMPRFPVYVVTEERLGLLGARTLANQALTSS